MYIMLRSKILKIKCLILINIATTTILTAVESKISNVSDLFKKTNYK